MRRLREAVESWREVLRFGVTKYRETFSGPSAAYVLADLREYCQCKPAQLEWQVLEKEAREEPDAWKEHMARARVYFRIRRFLDTTDAQIDAAAEHMEEVQGGVMNG